LKTGLKPSTRNNPKQLADRKFSNRLANTLKGHQEKQQMVSDVVEMTLMEEKESLG
jgi:hypothetical protein